MRTMETTMDEVEWDGWKIEANNITWIWSFFRDILLRDIFIIIIIASTQKFIIFLISHQDDVNSSRLAYMSSQLIESFILTSFYDALTLLRPSYHRRTSFWKCSERIANFFFMMSSISIDELGEFNWKFHNSAISAEFMAEIFQISNFMLELRRKKT